MGRPGPGLRHQTRQWLPERRRSPGSHANRQYVLLSLEAYFIVVADDASILVTEPLRSTENHLGSNALEVNIRGIPHLAKNGQDVGHP
jgi:hypothetical protein